MVERMVKRIFCDKCGKETDKSYSKIGGLGDRPLVIKDLCLNCSKELEVWIEKPTPVVVNKVEETNTTTYGKACKRTFKIYPPTLRELQEYIRNKLSRKFRSNRLTLFANTHPDISRHVRPMQYMSVYLKKLVDMGFLNHKPKSCFYYRV